MVHKLRDLDYVCMIAHTHMPGDTFFALVIAAVLICMISGSGGFFWQRYSIKTVITDIEGLKQGATVRVAGVEIGSVKKMDFNGDKVEVTLDVSKVQQPRITDRSV